LLCCLASFETAKVMMYPNPVSNVLTIEANIENVSIYNILGQEVLAQKTILQYFKLMNFQKEFISFEQVLTEK
jgi:hypothetical protein